MSPSPRRHGGSESAAGNRTAVHADAPHLTSKFEGDDAGKPERTKLFSILDAFIREAHPEYEARIEALKPIILQAPLRQRLHAYLAHLGIVFDDGALGRMLKLRNDVAHARPVNTDALRDVELQARQLARDVLRKELARQGLTLEGSGIEQLAKPSATPPA